MDNNQNGGVDRLMWPFRPVAQLIAIDVVQFEALHKTLRLTFQLVYGPRAAGGIRFPAAHADLYVGLAKGYLFVSSCDFCIGSQD